MNYGYRLKVEPMAGEVVATRGGAPVARSSRAQVMHETRLPPTVYLPAEDVAARLVPSARRTFCPFKGTAHYYDAEIGGERIEAAAWAYPAALSEAKPVEGLVGLMPGFAEGWRFETPPPAPEDPPISGPLVDWITRKAPTIHDGAALTRAFGETLVECGVAVRRLSFFIWSLHPQIAGVHYLWTRGEDEVEVRRPHYAVLDRPAFANSPLRHVSNGLGGVRQPLTGEKMEFDFPVLDEYRQLGLTDYVAMPLTFSDGRVNVLSMASDHPRGFTTENLGLVFECSPPLARFFEVQTLKANTVAVLDTYVGMRAGERVMRGEIRRGDGQDVNAAILFCDLVGSTRWADKLGRDDYLALLNGFFEAVAQEVEDRGGEVLKFIGDAVLAIFPGDRGAEAASRAAAEAAIAIPAAIADLRPEGRVRSAAGVSFGPVTYGNVGAPRRLDFTVIGAAATLAARLSDLAKAEGKEALVSAAVAEALPAPTSLGAFDLHNIAEPVEVYAP